MTGADFVAASQVRWNGVARTTTFVSATQLTAAISAADIATAGTAQVTVATPAPGGGISSAQPFTIIAPNPVPVVSALAPSSIAPGSPAFALTVLGSNFIPASEVRWNGAPRATLFVSSTQLQATIVDTDVATVGTAQVTVFTPAPGGGTSGAQTFLITTSNPVPMLSALAPSSVSAGGAAFTLSLAGTNFVATSQVRWNGAPRTTQFVSSTQLTATIADTDIATAGTAQVTVFTPAPGGGTSTAQAVTIIAGNPIPAVSLLAPSSATAGGIGFTLTVTGGNFVPASKVLWNGALRPTTFVSATRLTVAIAAADIASPGAVDVTVASPAPGGGASSALTFMRTPPKRMLTAKKQGTGSGKVTSSATVTSTAPALDCGATCAVRIDTGTLMTLQAVASAGSVFVGWSGPCTGTASTCSVVVDTDQTVTADFRLLSVVSFSAATYSVSEAGPAATITVTRSGGTHAGVSVDVATGDGTARAAADYVAFAQTLTFGAGQTSLTFAVPISNGTLADGNKTVTLALSNLQGLAVLGPRPTALLTIVDNDAGGTVQFSAASYTIDERASAPTTAIIRVTRAGGAASGVTVDFATVDGTARAGSDYTAVAQTLTFGAGETFKDVPVTILPDSLVEGDETIRLVLANPTGGARLGAIPSAALTILDAQIGVQFGAPAYRAGEGAGSATITVVRTGPTTRTTTVVYSTADGTAVAGVNYTATAGVLTFTPGTRSRTFTVPLREDTVVDGVKTVLLLLGATTDGELGPQRTAVLTVADNDAGGTLQFSAPTYSVSEGAALATITVVRTGGSASEVTVDFSTRNGTATASSDYVVTAGTLSFGANEASRTFTVSVLNDTLVKGPRTVGLTLSNPTGGAVLGTPATAVLNIVEDDAGGVLRFSAAGYRVSEGGLATITILRTGGAASGVTVSFTTADGTAVAGIDYTATAGALTFGAGETTKTFGVQTSAIAGLGRDRSATLVLSSPGGGAVLGTADDRGRDRLAGVQRGDVQRGRGANVGDRDGGTVGSHHRHRQRPVCHRGRHGGGGAGLHRGIGCLDVRPRRDGAHLHDRPSPGQRRRRRRDDRADAQ